MIKMAEVAELGPVWSVCRRIDQSCTLLMGDIWTVPRSNGTRSKEKTGRREHTAFHAIEINIFTLLLVVFGNNWRDAAAGLCEWSVLVCSITQAPLYKGHTSLCP